MGEIVAVLPVYGFHHVVGAVAVRQVDEPVGHGVGAVWANEEHRHELRAAFLLDPVRQIALDQVLPILGAMCF